MTITGRGWTRLIGMAWLMAALTTVGSSALADPVSSSELSSIHVIGLFSRLGDEIEIKKVGFTVFGNAYTTLNIAQWRLNDLVTNEAATALSSHYTINIATFDVKIQKDDNKDILHNLFGPNESPFLALPQSGLDAYLVFMPASEDFPYGVNQHVQGLGMVHDPRSSSDHPGDQPSQFDGTIFAPSRPTAGIVYAIYDIYLVSAKTGQIITVQQAEIPTRYHQTLGQMLWYGKPFTPIRYPHPHEYVASGIWSDTADTLTEAQQQLIRAKLTTLIKTSVDYSLGLMGLTSLQSETATTPNPPAPSAPASDVTSPPVSPTPASPQISKTPSNSPSD